MAAAISAKEIETIVDHLTMQGATALRTKKGVLLRFPDKVSTAMIHFSTSDVRARDNLRSDVKRAGMTWPFDRIDDNEVPDYVKRPILKRTRENGLVALRKIGHPLRVKPADLMHAWTELSDSDWGTLYRFLYDQGYRPDTNKKRAHKIWVRPFDERYDTVAEVVELPVAEGPEEESEVEEQVEPEVERGYDKTERIVLDSHDSWVVDTSELGEMTLDQIEKVYLAAGLQVELRVWRRS